MKKPIIVSVIVAGMLLMGGFLTLTQAQTPGTDPKPTLINPTPGLYVNGWPPFTVSYPKEWVELPRTFGDVFRAGGTHPGLPPGLHIPFINIAVIALGLPLEDWAKIFMPVWVQFFKDIKVLYDKPSQLKDGTPAREIEVESIPIYEPTVGPSTDAPKVYNFILLTKREGAWIWVGLLDDRGKIGEDLRKHAYSLTFLPGREEPVKVPPDVQAFLDMYCVDLMSHDVGAIMAHFADRFRHSGLNKAFYEQGFRKAPVLPLVSLEPIVTVFEAQGDRAYVDGFLLSKKKDDANALKLPMIFQQIIREHGQWKWYGNQK